MLTSKDYQETKVLIIPTDYGEGLSRILLEMINLQIPVLSSRNQGTEELLPSSYKYFIKSKNPAAIALQLNDLLKNHSYVYEVKWNNEWK